MAGSSLKSDIGTATCMRGRAGSSVDEPRTQWPPGAGSGFLLRTRRELGLPHGDPGLPASGTGREQCLLSEPPHRRCSTQDRSAQIPGPLRVAGGGHQCFCDSRVWPRLDANQPDEDKEASVCAKTLKATRPRLAGSKDQLLGSTAPPT